MQPAWKNRNSNEQYFLHIKEKNYKFSSKKPSATKHSPPSNVYYMEFYRIFLFEYSLIGIVKPKFTRRNEIWCRIWEIEDLSKNVRKKQDRTSLNCFSLFVLQYVNFGSVIFFIICLFVCLFSAFNLYYNFIEGAIDG